jgi:predicted transcriptional regulator
MDVEPKGPLESVEYLARSASRTAVLDAIHEKPRTRDELKNVTDASRTTLSRTLTDFEERGWVTRSNGQYEPTPEGTFVASEISRLLENFEAADVLDGALKWLPTDEFRFDLRRLRDAELREVRWDDPASMRKFAELFDGATRVRSTATTVSRDAVELLRNLTVEQGGSYEGVLAPSAVNSIRQHPELRDLLREMLESGRGTVYRYGGDEPLVMVMAVDELASICNHPSEGPQMEAVVSDEEAFHAWVERYVDSAITDSHSLTVDALVA